MSAYWTANQRFDWEVYLSEQGAEEVGRAGSAEHVLFCPDCGKPKLAVNTKKRKWRCFVCGDAGRDAVSLIVKVEQAAWRDAVQRVISGARRPIGSIDVIPFELGGAERPRPKVFQQIGVPGGVTLLGEGAALSRAGEDYCAERGILPLTAAGMSLGVCGSGRFRNRLIFPVFDSGRRLIFYQGRAMWTPRAGEKHIKTLGPKLVEDAEGRQVTAGPSDCMLNLQYVADRQFRRVAVVEGPIDCAHAWPDAVATFGKKISTLQVELLLRAGVREIDLCWDNDPPKTAPDGRILPGGLDAAQAVAPGLSVFFTVRVVHLPVGRDPGDLEKAEIDYYRGRGVEWGTGARLSQVTFELDV